MVKTTNNGVSNTNHLSSKPLPQDQSPRLEPAIHFYEVEYDDKSDSGDEAVIHI